MSTATARYAGHLRTEATHVASGNLIQTDAPLDNHGRGEAFSPTDLVATALGACMMTVMGIVAERHSLPLTGSTFTLTKHMTLRPRAALPRLTCGFSCPPPSLPPTAPCWKTPPAPARWR